MKTEYLLIRDTNDVRWVFEWVAGLEEFGTRTPDGKRVWVDGKHKGWVAMDWLRDRGYEPKQLRW